MNFFILNFIVSSRNPGVIPESPLDGATRQKNQARVSNLIGFINEIHIKFNLPRRYKNLKAKRSGLLLARLLSQDSTIIL